MCLYESEYEVKVSFEDLDPMNIVWHGNYMRYMEQARCDMLEKLHYTYTDIKNDGYATGSQYVDHTMALINLYNLTQFDK